MVPVKFSMSEKKMVSFLRSVVIATSFWPLKMLLGAAGDRYLASFIEIVARKSLACDSSWLMPPKIRPVWRRCIRMKASPAAAASTK